MFSQVPSSKAIVSSGSLSELTLDQLIIAFHDTDEKRLDTSLQALDYKKFIEGDSSSTVLMFCHPKGDDELKHPYYVEKWLEFEDSKVKLQTEIDKIIIELRSRGVIVESTLDDYNLTQYQIIYSEEGCQLRR